MFIYPKKAIIYARVSSKEQELGGFSIPAQLDLLKKYCKDHGFVIEKIFTEAMSAKETGLRSAYDEMIKFLRKSKKTAYNLVYEKNDRLLRNEYDSADVINLARTTLHFVHSVREGLVLHANAHPTTFFIFSSFSANSSLYSRNLSLEVKKGMYKAAELGYYPSNLPVGYKRGDTEKGTKRKRAIVIDPEKAGYIARAFELYATNLFSYKTLADKLASEGFVIKSQPCQKINIEKILNNPFYMGEFVFKGKRYTSDNYTPIISRELFFECQKIIEWHSSPRTQKHDFLYSGLIKCPVCGCHLVGEIKKGKYIYYRCIGRKCTMGKVKYLKEKTIDNMVEMFLTSISIAPKDIEEVLNCCKEIAKTSQEYDIRAIENAQKQLIVYKKRLNKLYDDKLDGTITEDFYFEKKEQYQNEIDKLQNFIFYTNTEGDILMEKITLCIELCKNAWNKYLSFSGLKKQYFLKILVSNFVYDGEKLTIDIKNAIKPMLNSDKSFKWWRLGDSNS